MGILIRATNEDNKLISDSRMQFITIDFFNLVKKLVELIQKHEVLKKELAERKRLIKKEEVNLQTLIEEQKQIDKEIKGFLDSKTHGYESLLESLDFKNLSHIDAKLSLLMNKLTFSNPKFSQTIIKLRCNSRRIETISDRLPDMDDEIKTYKILLGIEYKKVDWKKITANQISFLTVFENVRCEQLGAILKQIVLKNYEFEKSLVRMLHNVCVRQLDNNKCRDSIIVINEIEFLVGLSNKIYDFVFDLISRKVLISETIELLFRLNQILEQLNCYTKYRLNKDKSLNILPSVEKIKYVSELKKREVNREYWPTIFYKKKLQAYNFDSQMVCNIADEISGYLKSVENKDEAVEKTYILY